MGAVARCREVPWVHQGRPWVHVAEGASPQHAGPRGSAPSLTARLRADDTAHRTTSTGVGSSQGMLNELVLKYPGVQRLFPARFEDVPDAVLDPPFDLVVRDGRPGCRCRGLHALCSGLVVVT